MKKIVKKGLKGIPIGVFIGLLLSYLISLSIGYGTYHPAPPIFTDKFETELGAIGVSMILWSLIGVMSVFASIIYERDDWSILKQTSLHFGVMYIGIISIGLLAGWFELKSKELLVASLIFLFVYLVIWTISMLKTRRNIKKVNEQLKKKHEKEGKK